MTAKELEAELRELKADYARIQEDMEKLVFVGGRASSAEEQLILLEDKIAKINKKLDEIE